jgi:hypothetical protein
VLLVAVVTWFGFQTTQLVTDRTSLTTLQANQDAIYKNAQKMRAQLDALAAGTARLAEKGNTNALSIVASLRTQGISINPEKLNEPVKK